MNCNKTVVNIEKPGSLISITDNFFSVGSCFSDELSKYLNNSGIDIFSNPFGTIYNAYSIYNLFNIIFNGIKFTEHDLNKYQDVYFSFDHSTKYDGKNKKRILKKINKNIIKSKERIVKSNIFVITLGTSVIFSYKNENKVVANCHKLPHNLFKESILTVQENVEYLNKIIDLIKSNISNTKIIFTLSPVRHNNNDLLKNSISKSILRVAISKIINNKDILYFPSYEIVIDELRDYSNYKKDGVHLKKRPIQYIMTEFCNKYFDTNLNSFIISYKKVKKIIEHKPKNKKSNDTKKLMMETILKLNKLQEKRCSKEVSKQIFSILKKLVKYFYNAKDLIIFIEDNIGDDKLKKMFKEIIKIKKNPNNFDIKNIYNDENKKIKKYKLEIYTKSLLKNKFCI